MDNYYIQGSTANNPTEEGLTEACAQAYASGISLEAEDLTSKFGENFPNTIKYLKTNPKELPLLAQAKMFVIVSNLF